MTGKLCFKTVLAAALMLGLACGKTYTEEEPAPMEKSFLLPAGASLSVTPVDDISIIDKNAGQPFAAVMAEPVYESGEAVVPKGAPVKGVVSVAREDIEGIGLRLTEMTVAGGKTVAIETELFIRTSDVDSAAPPIVQEGETITFQLREPVRFSAAVPLGAPAAGE